MRQKDVLVFYKKIIDFLTVKNDFEKLNFEKLKCLAR